MMNPFVATNCPMAAGDYWAADSTRGITLDSATLSQVYYEKGPVGDAASYRTNKPRLVRIVKNATGTVLTRNLIVSYAVAAIGDFLKNIAQLCAADSQGAGVVEDAYLAGVPDGAYFRIVIAGEHYLTFASQNSARQVTAPGMPLVVQSAGLVWLRDNSVAAGAATFAQVEGVVGYSNSITTNDTNATTGRGTTQLCFVSCQAGN